MIIIYTVTAWGPVHVAWKGSWGEKRDPHSWMGSDERTTRVLEGMRFAELLTARYEEEARDVPSQNSSMCEGIFPMSTLTENPHFNGQYYYCGQ